jgi:hypothetical protein
LQYPAYSPDLALSDYHLYDAPEDALRGHRFATDQPTCARSYAFMVQVHKYIKNIFYLVYKEACGMLVQLHQKARLQH